LDLMMVKTFVSLLFVVSVAAPALAQSNIFLVRHAERADTAGGAAPMMAADPSLSDAGRQRAESLAAALKDAGISAIYATEFKRTQETAAPLAKALGLTVITVPANDTNALVEKLKAATANVLVVGHSNTVPEVVKALGISTPATIGDRDYDNLFVVTTGAQPRMIRLHYR
jgi:phosphohistidine phosphatase SixA